MADYEWKPRERGWAALFATVMMGAVLYPLTEYRRPRDDRVDGFPLSHYPMFSARRKQNTPIKYVVAVAEDGSRRYVRYSLVGPGGLNQVRRQLARAVIEDRVQGYAVEVAARVGVTVGMQDIVRVEVIEGIFDLDDCLLERSVHPAEETVLAGAEVIRGDASAAVGSVPVGSGSGEAVPT